MRTKRVGFGAVQSVEELVDKRGDGEEQTVYYCNNIIRDILCFMV